ncbi:MAG TPA: hypothetical protein VNT81_15095 [Vicinamibacterales bacterium]|nr:hypothetical protein [Vicinamibacterales bacterium]
MSETDRIARALIDRTLPKAEWTHEAHLRVGLWHVHAHGAVAALELLRRRISLYNESVGTKNTDTSGYHETLTRFYVTVIDRFLAAADRSMEIDELARALIAMHGDRKLPLHHYSEGKLFSVVARRSWVEPDLRPI